MMRIESIGYATPAWILRGIAIAESGERDNAIGDDGISRGRMQLNRHYDAERRAKWGAFDPFSPHDAIRIADCILMANLRALGSWDLAIVGYRQGVAGVRRNGLCEWYVRRIKSAAR